MIMVTTMIMIIINEVKLNIKILINFFFLPQRGLSRVTLFLYQKDVSLITYIIIPNAGNLIGNIN